MPTFGRIARCFQIFTFSAVVLLACEVRAENPGNDTPNATLATQSPPKINDSATEPVPLPAPASNVTPWTPPGIRDMLAPTRKVLPPLVKQDVGKIVSDTSRTTAEKFSLLRAERRNITDRINQLESLLDIDSASERNIPDYGQWQGSGDAYGINGIFGAKRSVQKQLDQIRAKIEELNKQKENAKNENLTNVLQLISDNQDKATALQNQLDSMDDNESRAKENQKTFDYNQKYYSDLRDRVISIRRDHEGQLHDARLYLSELDDSISSLFLNTDVSNNFKLWVSLTFAILVAIVIVGFFIIAGLNRKVIDIFSNDSGLQFITLFSLVIAIILFGVINILEGKELAALLGGLSGYILGRGAFARSTAGTTPPPPPPPA